ncbi:hypothetical protein J6590_053929 [Homalodisca vitripennis]|nr:hypothetical protein J6590_053929 [Homalodisca vitripennis]
MICFTLDDILCAMQHRVETETFREVEWNSLIKVVASNCGVRRVGQLHKRLSPEYTAAASFPPPSPPSRHTAVPPRAAPHSVAKRFPSGKVQSVAGHATSGPTSSQSHTPGYLTLLCFVVSKADYQG